MCISSIRIDHLPQRMKISASSLHTPGKWQYNEGLHNEPLRVLDKDWMQEKPWDIGRVWTFDRNSEMRCGFLEEGKFRYPKGFGSPAFFKWSVADNTLTMENEFSKETESYEFRLQSLDQSRMRLELPRIAGAYFDLTAMPRLLYDSSRILFYGLWLPTLLAAFLAYASSCKSAYSKKRAFFQCLLVTIALGAGGGAFLGFLEDTVYESDMFPHWMVLEPVRKIIKRHSGTVESTFF